MRLQKMINDGRLTKVVKWGNRTLLKGKYHKKKLALADAVSRLCDLTNTENKIALKDRPIRRESLRNMVNTLDTALKSMNDNPFEY